jgi:hypothetical protein
MQFPPKESAPAAGQLRGPSRPMTSGATPASLTAAGTVDLSGCGGGETEWLRVDLRPGLYALVSTVGHHRERGMVGSLTVR